MAVNGTQYAYRAVRGTVRNGFTACLQTLGRNYFSLIMNPLQDAARRPRRLGRTRRSWRYGARCNGTRYAYRAVRYATDSLCSTACLQTLGRNYFSLIT